MPVSLSRWSIARVEDAMTGVFGRVKRGQKVGFPRFCSVGRWSSFGFGEWKGIRLCEGKLLFKPIIGGLKVHLHRPIPDGAHIKRCTFTLRGRHWFITLSTLPSHQTSCNFRHAEQQSSRRSPRVSLSTLRRGIGPQFRH
ncbi:hypothetical protein ACQKLX_21000 [Bosea sp. NPDC003192]|uniref:hypothetical protein n=1 Tax=Bosea sp. NPDC003192 TaxID=3390551 RepID=UPI003CFDDAA3